MVVCQICYSSVFLQTLSCGCKYCRACLYEWFENQLKSFFQDDSQVVCPSSQAQHPVTEEDILGACSAASERSRVNSLLLKRTLLRFPDSRSCPNPQCAYIGWLDLSCFCLSSVECPLCHLTWKEVNVYPWYLRMLVMLVKIAFGLHGEENNEVWKWLWTKNCPNCRVAIEKNGGCSNMNCYKCKAAFCWTCLKLRRDHQNGTCFLIFSHSVLLACVLVLGLLLKIAIVEPKFWYPLSVIGYCLAFLLYFLALIITVAVTAESLSRCNSLLPLFGWWTLFLLFTCLQLSSPMGSIIMTHVGALALLAMHSVPLLLYYRVVAY